MKPTPNSKFYRGMCFAIPVGLVLWGFLAVIGWCIWRIVT